MQAIILSCDSNWAKTSSLISMWQCRRQKHRIPELLCSTRRTACSSRAGRSEFLQLLIKWKVIFQHSRLEGAAAVCMAAKVLAVINFMKQELQTAGCIPDSCLLWTPWLWASAYPANQLQKRKISLQRTWGQLWTFASLHKNVAAEF